MKEIEITIPKMSEENYLSFCLWAEINNVTYISSFK